MIQYDNKGIFWLEMVIDDSFMYLNNKKKIIDVSRWYKHLISWTKFGNFVDCGKVQINVMEYFLKLQKNGQRNIQVSSLDYVNFHTVILEYFNIKE